MGQSIQTIEKTYDAVAEEWAKAFADEHEKKPMDRDVLRRFSMEIGDRRPVWDFGCGPGSTTGYLNKLGVGASGLDLSERLLEQARAAHPGIGFQKGNMLALDFGDGSIAGVTAFYSIIHFTREQVRAAFREISRVLRPYGLLLAAYHIGDETIRVSEFLGKGIDIEITFFPTDFISGSLADTGFEGIETIERGPYIGVEYESRRAYVFARKPGRGSGS